MAGACGVHSSSSRQCTGLSASTSSFSCFSPVRSPPAWRNPTTTWAQQRRSSFPSQFGRSQPSIPTLRHNSPSTQQRSCAAAMESASPAPSSSPPSTLTEAILALGDEERNQLASEWGYEQLGAPLPQGLTPAVLTRSVPLYLAAIDAQRALLGMLAPLSLMVTGYAWLGFMHSIIPGWQQAVCWLLIGTGYFGLFTIAHDAAKLVLLAGNHQLQAVLGSLLMAPSLYSLEAWRVSLLIHFNQTNMLGEDDAGWQPLTKKRLAAMGQLERAWARAISTTPLKFLGSISHWLSSWGGFDLKRYFAPMRLNMISSWSVPVWFMALVWPALIISGGLSAWLDYWFMPWLVFHFWLSCLTLLQHTAPHIAFEEEGPSYDAAQAVVNGTVTVVMPRWLEFILNDANYHLPQHIYPGIPFYNARAATAAIQEKLGPYMTIACLNGKLLRNLVEKWQVYDEDKKTYVTFQQAMKEVEVAAA